LVLAIFKHKSTTQNLKVEFEFNLYIENRFLSIQKLLRK